MRLLPRLWVGLAAYPASRTDSSEPPLLSDVTQVTDTFGIRVVDAQLAIVEPAGRPPVAIESLRILPLGAVQEDQDAIAPRLAAALGATIAGNVPSDALNGLVLGAGLDWRQVDANQEDANQEDGHRVVVTNRAGDCPLDGTPVGVRPMAGSRVGRRLCLVG